MGRSVGARTPVPGRQQDPTRVKSPGTLRQVKRQLHHTNEIASDCATGSTAQHPSSHRDLPAGHSKRQYHRLCMPTASPGLTGSGKIAHTMGTNRASGLDKPTDLNQALEMRMSTAKNTDPNMNLFHQSCSHGYVHGCDNQRRTVAVESQWEDVKQGRVQCATDGVSETQRSMWPSAQQHGGVTSAGASDGTFSVLPGDVALMQAVGRATALTVHDPARRRPRQRATEVAQICSGFPTGSLMIPGLAAAGTLHPGLVHRCALCANMGRHGIECQGETDERSQSPTRRLSCRRRSSASQLSDQLRFR
jgi:hypothetical protein